MKFTEFLRLNESTHTAQPLDKDDLLRIIKDTISTKTFQSGMFVM